MRNLNRLSILLTTWIPLAALSLSRAEPAPTNKTIRLPNGLSVILYEDKRYPFVAVNTTFHAGPVYEPEGQSGISSLISRLMFYPSQNIWPRTRWHFLTRTGSLEDYCILTIDRMNCRTLLPSVNLETALWLESERIDHLLPTAWESTKGQITSDLADEVDYIMKESTSQADMQLWENLFPEPHPYNRGNLGDAAKIRRLTLAQAAEFYYSRFNVRGALLTIVGDINLQRAEELVVRYFGDIAGRKYTVTLPNVPLPELTASRTLKRSTDSVTYPTIKLAWLTPSARADDDVVADLVAQLLVRGAIGRLNIAFRDNPEVLGVSAHQHSMNLQSVFMIEIAVGHENQIPNIIEQVDWLLSAVVADGVEAQEIENLRKWERIRNRERTDNLMSMSSFLAEPHNSYQETHPPASRIDRYTAIDSRDVERFIKRYLAPNKRITQILLPITR